MSQLKFEQWIQTLIFRILKCFPKLKCIMLFPLASGVRLIGYEVWCTSCNTPVIVASGISPDSSSLRIMNSPPRYRSITSAAKGMFCFNEFRQRTDGGDGCVCLNIVSAPLIGACHFHSKRARCKLTNYVWISECLN